MTPQDARRGVDRALAERRSLGVILRGERDGLRAALRALRDLRRAQEVAQAVAEEVQSRANEQVESITTRCLQAVLGQDYSVRLEIRRARGRTDARVIILRGGSELDPLHACGGGVADVAALGLRLACLLLRRPPLRRLLVLDEPFRFVSAALRPRVRDVLEALCLELGLQVLLVTHDEALQVGAVVRIEKGGGTPHPRG